MKAYILPGLFRWSSRAGFAAICIPVLVATLCPVGAVAAESKPISFSATDKSFQQFIGSLRVAARDKDAQAVYALVAPNYYIARDFGGSFDPAASPIQNFSTSFQFENTKLGVKYKDHGWKEFREMISGRNFERKRDGQLCTPHGALDREPFPCSQLCFRKLSNGWRIQGHINGGD
ncbi:hypothetical protein [Massilia sp. 9I]|uniref:hypothetical protein n=1 Tax=Massilia sp. 9I TaxID=2653152 RepID=UPI0012F04410|nr:hypothetical protein [Massilia sp. 9I]VXB25504.1 conserved hypothetical protein [Massilia sp. 9I]